MKRSCVVCLAGHSRPPVTCICHFRPLEWNSSDRPSFAMAPMFPILLSPRDTTCPGDVQQGRFPHGAEWGKSARPPRRGVYGVVAELPTLDIPLCDVGPGKRDGCGGGRSRKPAPHVEEIPRVSAGHEFCSLGLPDCPLPGVKASVKRGRKPLLFGNEFLTMLAVSSDEES